MSGEEWSRGEGRGGEGVGWGAEKKKSNKFGELEEKVALPECVLKYSTTTREGKSKAGMGFAVATTTEGNEKRGEGGRVAMEGREKGTS